VTVETSKAVASTARMARWSGLIRMTGKAPGKGQRNP
jgi:hypothetical protein